MNKQLFERLCQSIRQVNDKIYADIEKHFGASTANDLREIESNILARDKRIAEYVNAKP